MDITSNPWSATDWNVTDQGKFFRLFGFKVSSEKAKAAGTYIGGPRPGKPTQPVKTYIFRRVGPQGLRGSDGATGLSIKVGFGFGILQNQNLDNGTIGDIGANFDLGASFDGDVRLALPFNANPQNGISMTAVITQTKDLIVSMLLGMDETQLLEIIKNIDASPDLGIALDALVETSTPFIDVPSAHDLGVNLAALLDMFSDVRGDAGLGVDTAVTLSYLNDVIGATPGLGVSMTATVDKVLQLAASPALGASMAVTGPDLIVNPSALAALGLSMAAAITRVQSISVSMALGADEAAVVSTIAPVSPSFVNSAFSFRNTVGNGITVNLPSITAGNLLMMFFANKTNQVTMNTPAGWTLGDNISPNTLSCWFWRIADGTEGSTVNLTWGLNNVICNVDVVQYTNVNTAAPFGTTNQHTGTASPLTAAAISTAHNSSTVLCYLDNASTTSLTVGTPSGFNIQSQNTSTGGSDNISDVQIATAGGSSSAASVASTSTRYYTYQIEIRSQ